MSDQKTEQMHTPGPWIWREGHRGLYGAGPDNAVLDYASYEGMWISWDQGQEVAEANARLIAAAPELFEALIELADAMKSASEGGGVDFHAYANTARAAIAKATGGQP